MLRARLALSVALSLPATGAGAGAWTQPEDTVLVIATTSRQMAPASAFLGETPTTDRNGTQIFLEYGLLEGLTVGLTAYGQFSATDTTLEARLGGHVRHRLHSGTAGDVVSIQAGASFPVERWFGSQLGDDRPDSASELDLRVLYGRGWQWDLGDSFVSGEAGLRIRGEGLDEELRVDATIGHTPTRGVLGLFSVFSTVPLGQKGDASLKLSPSVAYTLFSSLGPNDKKPDGEFSPNTLQLGLSWDALAPEDGLTVSLSVWRRF